MKRWLAIIGLVLVVLLALGLMAVIAAGVASLLGGDPASAAGACVGTAIWYTASNWRKP